MKDVRCELFTELVDCLLPNCYGSVMKEVTYVRYLPNWSVLSCIEVVDSLVPNWLLFSLSSGRYHTLFTELIHTSNRSGINRCSGSDLVHRHLAS